MELTGRLFCFSDKWKFMRVSIFFLLFPKFNVLTSDWLIYYNRRPSLGFRQSPIVYTRDFKRTFTKLDCFPQLLAIIYAKNLHLLLLGLLQPPTAPEKPAKISWYIVLKSKQLCETNTKEKILTDCRSVFMQATSHKDFLAPAEVAL